MSDVQHVGGGSLVVDNLKCACDGKLAIFKGLELDVKLGKFLSIIEPSSCGKTILFNLISGVFPFFTLSDLCQQCHLGDNYADPRSFVF